MRIVINVKFVNGCEYIMDPLKEFLFVWYSLTLHDEWDIPSLWGDWVYEQNPIGESMMYVI